MILVLMFLYIHLKMSVLTFFHYHHHDIHQHLYFHWKYIISERIRSFFPSVIGSILPLKALRTFSLQPKSNLAFLKQMILLLGIVPPFTFFKSSANMLYFKSECSHIKCSKHIFVNNTAGNKYSLTL